MRDASGVLTWYDLRDRLADAMQRASDLNLLEERKVLGDVIAHGTQTVTAFRTAAGVLAFFCSFVHRLNKVLD